MAVAVEAQGAYVPRLVVTSADAVARKLHDAIPGIGEIGRQEPVRQEAVTAHHLRIWLRVFAVDMPGTRR